MIRFADTVVVSRVTILLAGVANAAAELGLPGDVYVTSGNDKTHMVGSKHYMGYALDFRTRHLTPAQQRSWVLACRGRLGTGYDVVLETDHLHVEWDPRTPAKEGTPV